MIGGMVLFGASGDLTSRRGDSVLFRYRLALADRW
jgi:hypothetical protein